MNECVARYVVTTIEGDWLPRHASPALPVNLSAHVIDTAWNRRVVATYRTESFGRRRRFGRAAYATMQETRAAVIEAAQGDADRRNARAARLQAAKR